MIGAVDASTAAAAAAAADNISKNGTCRRAGCNGKQPRCNFYCGCGDCSGGKRSGRKVNAEGQRKMPPELLTAPAATKVLSKGPPDVTNGCEYSAEKKTWSKPATRKRPAINTLVHDDATYANMYMYDRKRTCAAQTCSNASLSDLVGEAQGTQPQNLSASESAYGYTPTKRTTATQPKPMAAVSMSGKNKFLSSNVVKKSSTSPSAKAGLQFPVELISRSLREEGIHAPSVGAPIYLAAVLEYLCAEILELAGNEAARDATCGQTSHNQYGDSKEMLIHNNLGNSAQQQPRIGPIHIKNAVKKC